MMVSAYARVRLLATVVLLGVALALFSHLNTARQPPHHTPTEVTPGLLHTMNHSLIPGVPFPDSAQTHQGTAKDQGEGSGSGSSEVLGKVQVNTTLAADHQQGEAGSSHHTAAGHGVDKAKETSPAPDSVPASSKHTEDREQPLYITIATKATAKVALCVSHRIS